MMKLSKKTAKMTLVDVVKSREESLDNQFKTVKLRRLTFDALHDIKKNNKLRSIDDAVSTLLLVVAMTLSEEKKGN